MGWVFLVEKWNKFSIREPYPWTTACPASAFLLLASGAYMAAVKAPHRAFFGEDPIPHCWTGRGYSKTSQHCLKPRKSDEAGLWITSKGVAERIETISEGELQKISFSLWHLLAWDISLPLASRWGWWETHVQAVSEGVKKQNGGMSLHGWEEIVSNDLRSRWLGSTWCWPRKGASCLPSPLLSSN